MIPKNGISYISILISFLEYILLIFHLCLFT